MAENEKIDIDLLIKTAESQTNLKGLNKELKNLVSAQGQVDKSSPDFKKLQDAINKTEGKVGDLTDAFKTLQGEGVERLSSSFDLMKEGFSKWDTGKIKIAFQGIGAAMKAVPILLLVEGIQFLIEKFGIITAVMEVASKLFYAITDAIGLTAKASEEKSKKTIEGLQKEQKALTERYDSEIAIAKAAGKDITKLEQDKLQAVEDNIRKQLESLQELQLKKKKLNEEEQKQFDELQSNLLKASTDRIAKENELEKARLDRRNEENQKGYELKKQLDLLNFKEGKERDLEVLRRDQENRIKDLKATEYYGRHQVEIESGFAKERQAIIDRYAKEAADKAEQERQRKLKEQEEHLKYVKEREKLEEESVKYIEGILAADTEFVKKQEAEKTDAVAAANAAQLNDSLLKIKAEQDAEKIKNEEKKKAWEEDKKQMAETFKEAQAYAQLTIATIQGISDLKKQKRDQELAEYNEGKQAEIDAVNANLDAELAKEGLTEQQKVDLKNKAAQEEYQIKLAQYNQNLAIKKKEFENGKKMAIAMALISGAVAAVNALSAAPFFPMAIIGLAMATITTVLAVAKIASQKFDGGGAPPKPPTIQAAAGSSGVGNSNSANPDQTKFLPPGLQKVGEGQGQFNPPGSAATEKKNNEDTKKVYVVADDVTKQQDKSAIIERRASFNK